MNNVASSHHTPKRSSCYVDTGTGVGVLLDLTLCSHCTFATIKAFLPNNSFFVRFSNGSPFNLYYFWIRARTRSVITAWNTKWAMNGMNRLVGCLIKTFDIARQTFFMIWVETFALHSSLYDMIPHPNVLYSSNDYDTIIIPKW